MICFANIYRRAVNSKKKNSCCRRWLNPQQNLNNFVGTNKGFKSNFRGLFSFHPDEAC